MRTLGMCLLLIIASSTAWGDWACRRGYHQALKDARYWRQQCRVYGATTTTVTTTTTTTISTTTTLLHTTIPGIGGAQIDCLVVAQQQYCAYPQDQKPDRIVAQTTTPCPHGPAQQCVHLALTPDYIPVSDWYCTPACSP